MPRPLVEVHHPGLDVTVARPASTARALVREGGWRYVDPSAVAPTVDHTIAEVLAQVGDDPVKAQTALDAELAGKNRKTLTVKLAEIVGDEKEA